MTGKMVRSLFGGQKHEYTRLGEIQNVKKSKVYVFGDDDVAEDDVVEFEMDSVRPRKGKKSVTRPIDDQPSFVERRLTDDDTLQSVSLQYGCPVSEIKRINNLIRDQDFYALKSVKIPVKQHSFLVDRIEEDDRIAEETIRNSKAQKSSSTSLSNGAACLDSGDDQSIVYESETDLTTDLSDPETQKHIIRNISINSKTRSQSKDAQRFLKNMDKDLSKILKTTRTERNSLDEVINVLTQKSVTPLFPPVRQKSKYLDCSLEWRTILVILVIVVIIAPIIFLVVSIYSSHNH